MATQHVEWNAHDIYGFKTVNSSGEGKIRTSASTRQDSHKRKINTRQNQSQDNDHRKINTITRHRKQHDTDIENNHKTSHSQSKDD